MSCVKNEQTQTHHARDGAEAGKVEGHLRLFPFSCDDRRDKRDTKAHEDRAASEHDSPDAVRKRAESEFGGFIAAQKRDGDHEETESFCRHDGPFGFMQRMHVRIGLPTFPEKCINKLL